MELLPPSEENPSLINGYSINYAQRSIGKFLVETKMDSPVPFGIWKCEKNAEMFSYCFRKMMKKVVFLVLIVSWSWTRLPAAVKFSGELLVKLSGHLCNSHLAFLFCNGIVFALFLLCRQTDVSTNSVIDGDVVYRCGGGAQVMLSAAEVGGGGEEETIKTVCGGTQVLVMPASEIFLAPPPAAEEDSGEGEEETIKTVCLESVVLKQQCNEVATTAGAAIITLQRQNGSGVEGGAIENLNCEEFRRRIEKFIRKNHEQFKVEKERGNDESMQKQQNININSLQIISY